MPEFFLGTTTSAGGDTTSVIDTSAWGGADVWNGRWIRFYNGTLDGETQRVTDFDGSGDHTTLAFSGNVPSGAGYERWPIDFHPDRIDDFIVEAIMETYGRAYNPVENLSLHTGGARVNSNTSSAGNGTPRTGGFTRFDVPSGISAISKVYYRESITSEIVHECEAAWDETVDADFTITVDSENKMRGNSSVKFSIAGTVSDGDFSTDSFDSIDLSGKTHIEMWVYVATAVAASDLALLLDDTASCASPVETLTLPAISARTWTFVRLTLANPESDTAVISIGLEYNANSGANTIWLDDIQAVHNDTSVWCPVSRRGWWLDQDSSDLVLSGDARADLGYTLLKLVGGDAPALLSADSDVNEVDDLFVIYKATELAYDSKVLENKEYARQAAKFRLLAEGRRKYLPRLQGARKVA